MSWSLQRLADALGLELVGPGDTRIDGVASLDAAEPFHLAFVAREQYADRLGSTRAGGVIVPRALADAVVGAALIAEKPHAAFARAAALLHPDARAHGERAPSAAIDSGATLAEDVDVGAGAVVGPGSRIGSGSRIAAGVVIGRDVTIGADANIGTNVVIEDRCCLGDRARIQPGAVVGGEGFGYVRDGDAWIRVPQIGRVVIGNDVQIGANTTIDRGALEDTVIGDGVLLDNLIQVAHNVRIGEGTAIAGCTGIAGSTVIGRRCTIGGAVGIVGHITIADDVHVTAMSLVSRSIPEAGTYSSGTPLDRHADWRRNAARYRQLDRLARRVGRLESGRSGTKE